MAWKEVKSRPAQKPRPSPDSTTARTDGSLPTRSPASTRASNMAGSRALSFSGRLSRTSATPDVDADGYAVWLGFRVGRQRGTSSRCAGHAKEKTDRPRRAGRAGHATAALGSPAGPARAARTLAEVGPLASVSRRAPVAPGTVPISGPAVCGPAACRRDRVNPRRLGATGDVAGSGQPGLARPFWGRLRASALAG